MHTNNQSNKQNNNKQTKQTIKQTKNTRPTVLLWMPEMYLTSTEQQGKITSHGLLAILWLMQSRRLMDFVAVKADCWLVVSLVSTMAPNSFALQSCLSPQLATWWQKSGASSFLHPIQCQTWLQYLQGFIPVKLQSLGRRHDTFLSCYL